MAFRRVLKALKKVVEIVNYRDLIGGIALLIGILAPICIFGYQILTYLKTGFWQSISVINVMQYYGIKWAFVPNDWLGLWKLLNMVNISVPIFIIFSWISYGFYNNQK